MHAPLSSLSPATTTSPTTTAAPATSVPATTSDAELTAGASVVVPIVAETIAVTKELTPIGAVRVRIEIDHASEHVGVDLLSEELQPTVRPVGAPANERLDPYRDGDDVVIPVYEERVVVERRLFLKEELRLRRVQRREHREGDVAVRRERAVVERQQPDGTWREIAAQSGPPVADSLLSSRNPSATD